MRRIALTTAAILTTLGIGVATTGCGQPQPTLVDYPTPQTWVFFYP